MVLGVVSGILTFRRETPIAAVVARQPKNNGVTVHSGMNVSSTLDDQTLLPTRIRRVLNADWINGVGILIPRLVRDTERHRVNGYEWGGWG